MLIPAILAALVGILGIPAAPWPPFIMASAYLVLGLQIGGNFDAAVLILAVHSLRLISVLVIGPYLVQFVAQRLDRQSGKAETSES
jgi:uncharacterized membrane protein AbrB (regulator of aidB expression)